MFIGFMTSVLKASCMVPFTRNPVLIISRLRPPHSRWRAPPPRWADCFMLQRSVASDRERKKGEDHGFRLSVNIRTQGCSSRPVQLVPRLLTLCLRIIFIVQTF